MSQLLSRLSSLFLLPLGGGTAKATDIALREIAAVKVAIGETAVVIVIEGMAVVKVVLLIGDAFAKEIFNIRE